MKRLLFLIIILLLALPVFSRALSSYDFTFYKTVEDSMNSLSREEVGLDVTGYGFLGTKSKGVYLRVGLQTPFDNILALLYRTIIKDEDPTEDGMTVNDESWLRKLETYALDKVSDISLEDADQETALDLEKIKTQWSASMTLGPAYRSQMGEKAMVYLGTGFSWTLGYESSLNEEDNTSLKRLNVLLGGDLDGGFRVDAKENTTIRIGVHFTMDALAFDNWSTYSMDNEILDTRSYAYLYMSSIHSLSGVGYIRLAKTYRNRDQHVYNYSNTTDKVGKGTLVEVE